MLRSKFVVVFALLLAILGIAALPVYLELRRMEAYEDLIDLRRELLERREQMWREHETHRNYLDQVVSQNRRLINIANKSVGEFINEPGGRQRMIDSSRVALKSLWHAQQEIRRELSPRTMVRPQSDWGVLTRQWATSSDEARVAARRQDRWLQSFIPGAARHRETMLDLTRQQNVLFEEQDRVWRIIQDREVGFLHGLEAELVLLDGFEKKLVSIVP